MSTKFGLFVGLVTLDLLYLTEGFPAPNQKIVAIDSTLAAGGPATNAAVAFSYLGNQAFLLGAIGTHPITQLVTADLQQQGVAIADLASEQTTPPPTSSIIVTQATGDRAVVSLNATRTQQSSDRIPDQILQTLPKIEIVLIDGHQVAVSAEIARQAAKAEIPIVIDGGSWKPGLDEILPQATYIICSANFYPPGCQSEIEVFDYLSQLEIPYIAMTHGGQSISYRCQGQVGEIAVPPVQPADTLGAGDIFHGAFCHYILQSEFKTALAQAAQVASYSCQFFGTRHWIDTRPAFA